MKGLKEKGDELKHSLTGERRKKPNPITLKFRPSSLAIWFIFDLHWKLKKKIDHRKNGLNSLTRWNLQNTDLPIFFTNIFVIIRRTYTHLNTIPTWQTSCRLWP